MSARHRPTSSELLASASCVLFDFDGPLCHLFSGRPADGVARRMAEELRRFGCDPDILGEGVRDGDPLALLQAVAGRYGSHPTTTLAERCLAAEEAEAAASATPTEHALELMRALGEGGRQQAVTTNNSAGAVIRFFARHDPAAAELMPEDRIHGRTSDPGLLKPHPHCLVRALESTGSAAADAVMIGDSPADCLAARAVGVPFIGYAVDERKRSALEAVGARWAVRSLEGLAETALRRVRDTESRVGPLPAGVHG